MQELIIDKKLYSNYIKIHRNQRHINYNIFHENIYGEKGIHNIKPV